MRLLKVLAATLVVTVIHVASAAATTGVVQRETNLRTTPSTQETPRRLLLPATRVDIVEPEPRDGFLHVKTPDGEEGWVWARNIRVEEGRAAVALPGRAPARRAEARATQPLADRAAAARRKSAGACADSLADCPDSGCAGPDEPHGLLNRQKRTIPPDGSAKLLTFKNLRALQAGTDKVTPEGVDISDRSLLHNIDVGGLTAGEGDLVDVVGFIAPDRTLRPGSAESVNCRLTGAGNNDVHVPIVEHADDSEFQSLVVEPIPQHRDPAWTLTALQRLQSQGTLLLIRGQLFYDNLHQVNDDPEHQVGTQPKRFTLWEVHPITHILTCAEQGNACDPGAADQWSELGGH